LGGFIPILKGLVRVGLEDYQEQGVWVGIIPKFPQRFLKLEAFGLEVN